MEGGDLLPFLQGLLEENARQRGSGEALPYTHGFHAYAGAFAPAVPEGLLARFARAGQRVLDPFCGGGTTLVEAHAAGAAALGVDASPLACLVARVRTTTLAPRRRRRLEQALDRVAGTVLGRVRSRTPCPELPPLGRLRSWFPPQVVHELGHLRLAIRREGDEVVRDALRACLSAVVVKVSLRRSETSRTHHPRRIAPGLPTRFLAGKAADLVSGLEALADRAGRRAPNVVVRPGDARRLDPVDDASVDLVITSPPYAGTYDYLGLHELRYPWLDLDPGPLERAELGSRRKSAGAVDLGAWRSDLGRSMGELARVLVPGGRAFLLTGDGRMGGRPLSGDAPVREAARAAGLACEAVARTRLAARRPRAGGASAEEREEQLIALQRPGP
ncbi:MAG: hypothetical protein HY722_02625 [Planctomycetes bacterium]|nr:hypothetical protein [Planctomycetota bacterium]